MLPSALHLPLKDRVFNSVLFGIVTHDANLLVLSPRRNDATGDAL